jgi:t-SNARE complex subunit (syntaxin)
MIPSINGGYGGCEGEKMKDKYLRMILWGIVAIMFIIVVVKVIEIHPFVMSHRPN